MKRFSLVFIPIAFLVIISCSQRENEVKYSAPEWAEGIVWYQIFPERFRDGDKTNQPNRERARGPEGWAPTEWAQDWYKRDAWEINYTDDFYAIVRERRYGGDLQGVIDKLDYLKNLGVGAIYFNPVFDAQSMHKYDATYYHHIDRNFGPDPEGDVAQFESEDPGDPDSWGWTEGDKLFLELIKEAHARDIKVVIDGVFNHTGTEFWAFQDLVKNQENSAYKDWYVVTSFDDPDTPENEFDYEGWWGFKGLPIFREENENLMKPTKDHIFEITRRWMDPNGDGDPSDGVDGWRLDVASEVGKNFWRDWHAFIREINPEVVTIAEIWNEEAKEFITADMFTTVMNYRFAYAVKGFFIDQSITANEFANRFEEIKNDYPEGSLHVLQNLMDSHDTPRLATMIVNKGQDYNPDRYPEEGYEVRKPNEEELAVQKLIATFMFTWKGSPMIYYGTESGMWGADDPDDRKPMVWDDMEYEVERNHPYGWERPADENNFNTSLHNFYMNLANIRNENPVLKKGDVQFLLLDEENQFIVFTRSMDGEKPILVALNRSSEVQTFNVESCNAIDLVTQNKVSEGCTFDLEVPPVGSRVIRLSD